MSAESGLVADAVFEGGGVKGIGLVGAVAVAEEKGYKWANVAGTSAGAIVAALLAAGYSAREMKRELDALNYSDFKDRGLVDRIPFIGLLVSLIFEKGIYEGRFFEDWMRRLLKKKGVSTFGDLVDERFKDEPRYRFKLRVIASDISRGRMLVLPQDVADFGMRPEALDVARAVRMSMSLPFFYEPVRLKKRDTGQVSYIVDGGVLSNFPVSLSDTGRDVPEWPTFGFKLVEPAELVALKLSCPYDETSFGTFELLEEHLRDEHAGAEPAGFICPYRECVGRTFTSVEDLKTHLYSEHVLHRIRGPVSLGMALVSTMTGAHDSRHIRDADFVRTIPIPTLDVKTTDFDLDRQRSDGLYESGRSAAERFFEGWDWDTYVAEFRSGKPRVGRGTGLRSGKV